jgi:hypothetical protein
MGTVMFTDWCNPIPRSITSETEIDRSATMFCILSPSRWHGYFKSRW